MRRDMHFNISCIIQGCLMRLKTLRDLPANTQRLLRFITYLITIHIIGQSMDMAMELFMKKDKKILIRI